jgi:ATP phosphoribosyltransferase
MSSGVSANLVNSTASRTRLALPKGKLLAHTADFLNAIGLGFDDYNAGTRIYRMRSQSVPGLLAKMLNERDIPVQVAVGNYDFGICSSDWLQELQARYPASRVFKVADLGYDKSGIYLACSASSDLSAEQLSGSPAAWRIVTEYPALAEAAACKLRLKRYRIFPCWGSAEAYPPENADFAVLRAKDEDALRSLNLKPISRLCDSNACIIASQDSLQAGDFSALLNRFASAAKIKDKPWRNPGKETAVINNDLTPRAPAGNVWLALADGHQQVHTSAFLEKAGISMEGYSKDAMRRRPSCGLSWLSIKVIRPQDMPQQVANGNFDLAITGRDWLLDHLCQFPSSPLTELADLSFGRVRVVAVVNGEVPADSINGIREIISRGKMAPLRIATEYVNIADKYLRDKHIARYRVIPTWGATEVYLPEDADMLIENTETGQTLARHKLKIIDTLFESTACLIGNKSSLAAKGKKDKIEKLVKLFREAAGKK